MVQPLDVQLFLETRTFGELDSEWGINARVSTDGHKFSLNYDMISWTPGHKPSEQCRGLVLGLELAHGGAKVPHVKNKPDPNFCPGKTVIYAYPMDKFYNSEEGHAYKIDWESQIIVEDKLDGTLAILYWDGVLAKWCMSTRSVPDADLPIDGWPDMTFRTLFDDAVLETTCLSMKDFTSGLSPAFTYCFELTGPYNRIMVDYKKPGLTLLMVRCNHDYREQNRKTMQKLMPFLGRIPLPKTWTLGSYEEIKSFVNELSPLECEGAVVMDKDYNRIKIKSMKWLVANATKTTIGASPRNLVRYVLQGVDDDVKSMLPADIAAKLDDVKLLVKELFAQTDANFASWKAQAMSRKHFADFVKLHEGWQGPYFRLYEGRAQSTSGFVNDLLKSDRLSDAFIDGILKYIKVGSHESCSQKVVSD